MKHKTCCFIGHKRINQTVQLKENLTGITEELINEGTDTFLLGSRSEFNGLCCDVLSSLKEKYPHIKRIYVRAEYPVIGEDYKRYLLSMFEDTYFPEKISGAGKERYIERNFHMIDKSDLCVFYFDEGINYQNRKSGTRAAYCYAGTKGKRIINAYLPSS